MRWRVRESGLRPGRGPGDGVTERTLTVVARCHRAPARRRAPGSALELDSDAGWCRQQTQSQQSGRSHRTRPGYGHDAGQTLTVRAAPAEAWPRRCCARAAYLLFLQLSLALRYGQQQGYQRSGGPQIVSELDPSLGVHPHLARPQQRRHQSQLHPDQMRAAVPCRDCGFRRVGTYGTEQAWSVRAASWHL